MDNIEHYLMLVGVISIVCTSLKKETFSEIFVSSLQLFFVFTSVMVGFSLTVQAILWFL